METALIAALSSLFGAAVGGVISYYLQRQQLTHEYKLKLMDDKTRNVAEETVRYYLKEEKFIERSFEHLKNKLGGFEEDEIRRILVRAGAVRFFRTEDDNKEFWCLVERLPEKYAKETVKREARKNKT